LSQVNLRRFVDAFNYSTATGVDGYITTLHTGRYAILWTNVNTQSTLLDWLKL